MLKKLINLIIEYRIEIVFFFILSLFFTFPILITGKNLGIQDWDQYLAFLESAKISLLKYGEFPFWNPFHCGGMPGFGHPQSNYISITFIFVIIFGTVLGVKISILFHYWLLCLGSYLLARCFKITKLGSFASSIILTFSGPLSSALGTGMLPFLSLAYVPLTLFFYLKALHLKKIRLFINSVIAFLLAINFYTGYHIILIFSVTLFIFPFYFLIKQKNIYSLINALIVLIMFLLLSSPKLFLSLKLMSEYPRPIIDQSGYKLQNLLYFLLSKIQNYHGDLLIKNFDYNVDENSLYIGIFPFILFIFGLIKSYKEKKLLLIGLIVNLWLMFGVQISLSLYNLLKQIYLYNFFRVAQRFRFLFIVFLSLFVGIGMDFFIKKFKKNKFVFYLLIGFIYIDLFIFSYLNFFSKTFIISNPESIYKTRLSPNFESISQLNIKYDTSEENKKPLLILSFRNLPSYLPWSSEYLAIRQNKGTISCYEVIPIIRAAKGADENDYKGEVYFLSGKGVIKIKHWSPNKIIINAQPNLQEDIIILNQNYDSGWHVIIDGKIIKANNYSSLVSVKIYKHQREVIFLYNPYKSLF